MKKLMDISLGIIVAFSTEFAVQKIVSSQNLGNKIKYVVNKSSKIDSGKSIDGVEILGLYHPSAGESHVLRLKSACATNDIYFLLEREDELDCSEVECGYVASEILNSEKKQLVKLHKEQNPVEKPKDNRISYSSPLLSY